jgi:ubiquinone/menaquinone biosynthesis C-methylase UbiE
MLARPVFVTVVGITCVVFAAAAVLAWRFAIFVLPLSLTGEADDLAKRLHVTAGSVVADIGAGDGSLAFAIAKRVGASGTVYATELDADRLGEIAERLSRSGISQVRVVQGATDVTRLPDRCCDAIYMRTVFHHIQHREAFAAEVRKALRPGGRVAIIDFPPGALWFHGDNHGVAADNVIQAFEGAGLRRTARVEDWGGGTYFLLFELESAYADVDHPR